MKHQNIITKMHSTEVIRLARQTKLEDRAISRPEFLSREIDKNACYTVFGCVNFLPKEITSSTSNKV